MDIEQALDRRTKRARRPLLLRQVVVTAVNAGPPASVNIEDNGPITGVRYLNSYTPTVNDVVWAMVDEPDILVLGKLA